MASVDNRLEESISDFFSKAGAGVSRSECDAFANKCFGGPARPVPVQGLYSYTVVAANETVIVQFREADSPLDIEVLATLRTIHPDFIASYSFHGTIGSSPALLICSMNKLPGDAYFNISLSMFGDELNHQLTTTRSLARFFAQSWLKSSRPDPKTVSAPFEYCCSSFNYLRSTLPSRFQRTVTQAQENLQALFSGEYPLVLTHGDLNEKNILANPATGEITGIVDWAEVGIMPFGFALYALDNVLGYLTPDGWVFHSTAEQLRDEFWRSFCKLVGGESQREMELIQLAKLAGVFLRYGIPYQPGRKGVIGVGGAKSASIKALDGLILGEKAASPGQDVHACGSSSLLTEAGN